METLVENIVAMQFLEKTPEDFNTISQLEAHRNISKHKNPLKL
jgi:hypothetical protein